MDAAEDARLRFVTNLWWWRRCQNFAFHQPPIQVSHPLPISIREIEKSLAIVLPMTPGPSVLGAVGEVVDAQAAALAVVPPSIVGIAVCIFLNAFAVPLSIMPGSRVLEVLFADVGALALLPSISPVAFIVAAIRPDVPAFAVELVDLELADVLEAGLRVLQRPMPIPQEKLELPFVVTRPAIQLLATEAELLPSDVRLQAVLLVLGLHHQGR
mmetsp:Transcript_105881/g.252576  ORF Transcript_105881/g.252576 Transcript_105881/m.252576 type:complete len:213 (-) Transcript_105881:84-722(-)